MSSPDSSPGRRARTTHAIRASFELLALRLSLHGPEAATLRSVRPLARSFLWLDTRSLLREHGFQEYEMAHLMGTHPEGCACWDCIKRLRDRVLASKRRRQARHGERHVPRRAASV